MSTVRVPQNASEAAMAREPMSGAVDDAAVANEPREPARRSLLPMFATLATLSAFAWIAWMVWDRYQHLYVEDARIGADVIAIASRVPGWVNAVHVGSTDEVRQGDELIALDAREAQSKLTQLEARLLETQAARKQAEARLEMVDRKTASQSQVFEARLEAARALFAATASELELAESDFERIDALLANGVASRQQWDEDRTRLAKAQQDHHRAEADVAVARAALLEASADRQQLAVLRDEQIVLEHREEQVLAERDQAKIDLNYQTLRSPIDGVVDRVFVNPGEYVQPGQRLVMLHNREDVWVDCNVLETDIRFLWVGMPAEVAVDGFPNESFEGQVVRIGDVATSQFALLPNPNPSGNFTKITQRVPVRVALEQRGTMLRPGMMVEVKIAIDR